MAGGSGSQGSSSTQQTPQWLSGLKLGQQIAQLGQPQGGGQMMPHPMMGGGLRPGMPPGMQQGGLNQAMPGAVPQQPMGMANGSMGMPPPAMPNNGQQGGINPALLQMLTRSQQR